MFMLTLFGDYDLNDRTPLVSVHKIDLDSNSLVIAENGRYLSL